MAEEIDWIALQSLKMAQEAEDDAAERHYSKKERWRVGPAFFLSKYREVKYKEGDYAGAEALFRQTLKIYEKQFGPEGLPVASLLRNHARLLWESNPLFPAPRAAPRKGDLVAAEKLFWRVLAIERKHKGPDHGYVVEALDYLALVLEEQGEYAAAELLYRRKLAIKKKRWGPESQDVGCLTEDVARMLEAQGEYAAAEPLYRRALAIAEKIFGPFREDPRVFNLKDTVNRLKEAVSRLGGG